MDSIEGQLSFDKELMSDYYDELASSINWWAEPARNRYVDLNPIQRAKFSGLILSITKKNGLAKTSAVRQFIDIVGSEP